MKKKKKSVYATGGKVDYIQNPHTELAQDQINKVQAMYEANTNPLLVGLDSLGKLTQGVASSMGPAEGDSISPDQVNSAASLLGSMSTLFAMGGVVPNKAIEAEGEEIVETPDGTVSEIEGPKHEQGGVNLLLPPGTEIFSDRLLGIDGKTMADRKVSREKKLNKIQKLYDKSPSDMTLKKTLDRVMSTNEIEEQKDLEQMEIARASYNAGAKRAMGGLVKYVTGGLVGEDPEDPYGHLTPQEFLAKAQNFLALNQPTESTQTPGFGEGFENIFDNITFGDGIGMAGNLMSTFAPMLNTQRNRAGDTPNINAYKNFGQDGLAKMDESKKYVAGQRDNALQDVRLSANSARRRGRNSARGVNTARALDLATTMQEQQAQSGIYDQFSKIMQSILGQEAQLENQQDRVVMAGEQQRDLADRQDRDNYFSNLAQDISTKGTGLQKIGKDINTMKQRGVTGKVLNDIFPNFNIDAMSGDTNFVSEATGPNKVNYIKIPNEANRAKAVEMVSAGTATWKNGKLYNSNGELLDLTTLKPKS